VKLVVSSDLDRACSLIFLNKLIIKIILHTKKVNKRAKKWKRIMWSFLVGFILLNKINIYFS